MSACLGNWETISWVNPQTFQGDWVNLMSYGESYDNATVEQWREEGNAAVRDGLTKSQINIVRNHDLSRLFAVIYEYVAFFSGCQRCCC